MTAAPKECAIGASNDGPIVDACEGPCAQEMPRYVLETNVFAGHGMFDGRKQVEG